MRLLLLVLCAAACQQAPKTEPAPLGSASAAAPRAPASSAAPAKAWFEGAWQGQYRAELFRLEVPAGGVKDWKLDDGKLASGEGKLAFVVQPDGTLGGSSSGALGELVVSGRVDGDRAALELSSAAPDGFHGVILATQTPDGMKGALNASSGNSLQARQASVTFTRAAP